MNNEFNFQWHITNRCNLRCRHCYQDDYTANSELEWPRLRSIADNILDTLKGWGKTTSINITGGEPMLKKELTPLLEYLNKSPQVNELTIITNGTLIDENSIAFFKKIPKLKNIKLSLDGASEEINGYIREPGSLETVKKAIRLIKSSSRLKVIIMFTLMKKNLKDTGHIFDLCKEEGSDSLILERFIPQGQGSKIRDEVLDKNDWREVVDLVTDFCSLTVNEKDILPFKAFWVKFRKNEPLKLYGATCNVADQSLCIMPDAKVYPCRRFNKPIGDLLDSSLKNIWENSPLLKEVRKRSCLKGKCATCDIDCFGCRALAYSMTGDYLAEDSQCWYINNRSKRSEKQEALRSIQIKQ
ncbi:MAG: radical SAM protein [Candidatus Omnitrophica bacterium]|nr:radical SAM protein [Candidatus Omnitrophota bacterium]